MNRLNSNIVIEEIQNQLTQLQTIISQVKRAQNAYQYQQFVEESYINLRKLLMRFKEYQKISDSMNYKTVSPDNFKLDRFQVYVEALYVFWYQNRSKLYQLTLPGNELSKETNSVLQDIIINYQVNRSRSRQRSDLTPVRSQAGVNKSPISKSPNQNYSDILAETPTKSSNSELFMLKEELKQAHRTIGNLRDDYRNLQKLLQLAKDEIIAFQIDNNKKTIRISILESQLDIKTQQLQDYSYDSKYLSPKYPSRNIQTQGNLSIRKENPEISLLMQQNQKILDENYRLSEKIKELYLERNQTQNLQEYEMSIRNLQIKLQGFQEQVNKNNEEKKKLNQQNEILKLQLEESQNLIKKLHEEAQLDIHKRLENKENTIENPPIQSVSKKYGKSFLPDMEVGSHFNSVIHILENLREFSNLIRQNQELDIHCRLIQKLFSHIRGQTVLEQEEMNQLAANLSEAFPIEYQRDNQANDLIFQIIDSMSHSIQNEEGEGEISTIAKFIQAKDSPIYGIFFFLQRSLPLQEEIQNDEVPLINSIKHVRYLKQIGVCQDFSHYLQQLTVIEGEETQNGPFTFVILPNVLIFNVGELSQAKTNLKINQQINSNTLTNNFYEGEHFSYHLVGMVHCQYQPNDNQPIYYLTINTDEGWFQVLYDQYEQISNIQEVLTFSLNYGDKELLIYEKGK